MSNRPKMELVYYLNVFRGHGGAILHSDLSGATAIHTFEAAVAEARIMAHIGYAYVCTLSNLPEDVTPKIRKQLEKEIADAEA